jgi:hypothetical protein
VALEALQRQRRRVLNLVNKQTGDRKMTKTCFLRNAICSVILTTLAGPACADSPGSASGTQVIVKPIEIPANAPEIPQDVDRVVNTVIGDLTRSKQALDAKKADIAVCYDNYRKAQGPNSVVATSFYECLAKPTAETRAVWQEAAMSFQAFGKGLSAISDQARKVESYVGEQQQQADVQARALQAQISKGRTVLQLAQETRARGKTLTPEETRQLRELIDDVMSANVKMRSLQKRQVSFDQKKVQLQNYVKVLAELQSDSGVLEHRARNRADVWAATLEDIGSRGAIAAFEGTFSKLEEGLAGFGNAFSDFGDRWNDATPPLIDAMEGPETDGKPITRLRLSTGNLDADLDAVLKQTAQ